MSSAIPIGVAGLGHRGLHWVHQLLRVPGYRITAVYDWITPLHEKALALIPYRDDVKTFIDWDDFLVYTGMDAVALCVRQMDQGKLAADALTAGKHVSAEVPAAHTIEDCWRIVLAAERTGKLYHLGEQTRYMGYIDAWRNIVASGRLGKVVLCEGQYIGYYGTRQFFQDFKTGRQFTVDELPDHPEAKRTMLQVMQPIEYLPHELSPMLKVLDDRVTEVTAMSTREQSYSHPEINQADMQMALMKTEKDTILRMATSFMLHEPPRSDHHWYNLMGTRGRMQWRRHPGELPLMWIADSQMHSYAEIDWRMERVNAPDGAKGSGHGDSDYYVHAHFRDAVLGESKPDIDVYQAIDTAAPAILASTSIKQGSAPQRVPDFRPGPNREVGEAPADA